MGICRTPKGIDEAIRKGGAGEGVATLKGTVLCPYSFKTPWYWAWTGAYQATHPKEKMT